MRTPLQSLAGAVALAAAFTTTGAAAATLQCAIRQVTNATPESTFYAPDLSADGRYIAALNGSLTNSQLRTVLIDLDTGDITTAPPQDVLNFYGRGPTISANAERIVFDRRNSSCPASYSVVWNPTGQTIKSVAPCSSATLMARISASGDAIALQSIPNNGPTFPDPAFALSPFQTIVAIPPGSYKKGTSFDASTNSDGTRIAFQAEDSHRRYQYYLFDIVGRRLTRLTDFPDSTLNSLGAIARLSGNGLVLGFSSYVRNGEQNPQENEEIFTFDTLTNELAQVTKTAADVSRYPALDQTGRFLAFLSNADLVGENPDHNQHLFLKDRLLSETYQVTHGSLGRDLPVVGDPPAMTPDGTRFAWSQCTDWTLGYCLSNLFVADCHQAFSPCVESPTVTCLNNGRFQVEVGWRTANGAQGQAQRVTSQGDSVLLWFFAPSNWEATVKVLDACGLNGRFWVFAGGMTDVEVSIRITDTHTGAVWSRTNPLGTLFRTIADTQAFASCP